MQRIDARGRMCPLPLFYTKRKIEEMQAGEELEVITDDPIAKETIPRWSREHGHEVIALEEQENCCRIVVRKRS
jgi:tRNA 2-thiouridine synthesizing protein A